MRSLGVGLMPAKTVFISYSHRQGDWVWSRLKPVLEAGGATVLIDRERFEAGKDLDRQEEEHQDKADLSILVLSPDYLKSRPCLKEMDRAILRDPRFARGEVVTILRIDCDMPNELRKALYLDLRADADPQPWDLLLKACDADLGAAAPDWLTARDAVVECLGRHQSVNLVVKGNGQWRGLIEHVRAVHVPRLGVVDLERGATCNRKGLIEEILKTLGGSEQVPSPPEDLVLFDRFLSKGGPRFLAIMNFDHVSYRPDYDVNLFGALRWLINSRNLVLLAQSRRPFATFLPYDHPLSVLHLDTVIFKGSE